MKERGILFSAPMVRALLAGTKSQTRRLAKLPPWPDGVSPSRPMQVTNYEQDVTASAMFGCYYEGWPEIGRWGLGGKPFRSPCGVHGDRLWVREAWSTAAKLDKSNATQIAEAAEEAGYVRPWCPVRYAADGHDRDHDNLWGPWGRPRLARFMPRWASRLLLEVADVRVERLQDISEADAEAEGISEFYADANAASVCALAKAMGTTAEDPRASYAALWESINGTGSWALNPWLWAVSFRRVSS